MASFDKQYKTLLESFGGPMTMRMHAPRVKLSSEFVKAFKEEYKRLCAPEQILDENDQVIDEKPKNKRTVLAQMQKALPFLAR